MGPVLGPAVGSFSSSLLSSFIDDIFSKKDTTPEQLINKIGELENNVEKNKKEEIDLLRPCLKNKSCTKYKKDIK